MKPITNFLFAVITASGFVMNGSAQAQDSAERPAVSVPIVFVGAEPREAPTEILRGLMNDGDSLPSDGSVAVVDVSFAVEAGALSNLAPSLQPRLFVGSDFYEVLRVEYENWDPVKSEPLDASKPVGLTHFYHFLIPMERADKVQEEATVFMTTLTWAEVMRRAGAELTRDSLKNVDASLSENSIQIDRAMLIER